MNYAAADVKRLREETGATFADCKNALSDAATWEEALKLVEAKRDKKAQKMQVADRETKQGGHRTVLQPHDLVPDHLGSFRVLGQLPNASGPRLKELPGFLLRHFPSRSSGVYTARLWVEVSFIAAR